MKLKKLFVICLITFFTQSMFAYNYKTEIYDWNGTHVYNVAATSLDDGSHVVGIYAGGVAYCFVYYDKSTALEMYLIMSRGNALAIDQIIQEVTWKYWYTSPGGCIFYIENGWYRN